MLIVFEGANGVGKTTQALRVQCELMEKGLTVITPRDPGSTKLGEYLRPVCRGTPVEGLFKGEILTAGNSATALMFMAARAQMVEELIKPEMEKGTIIILDRFSLSTYVYQCRMAGFSEDAFLDIDDQTGVHAYLQVIFEGDPETCLARAKGDSKFEKEGLDYQRRLQGAYMEGASAIGSLNVFLSPELVGSTEERVTDCLVELVLKHRELLSDGSKKFPYGSVEHLEALAKIEGVSLVPSKRYCQTVDK